LAVGVRVDGLAEVGLEVGRAVGRLWDHHGYTTNNNNIKKR
jgi:hypothetical protein